MTARSGRILFTCLILDRLLRLFALDETNIVNHTGPMIAGEKYELQCLIHNVHESVNVTWYKGGPNIVNQTIHNETIKSSDKTKTSKVQIHPERDDDGALYWCEAKLKTKGPQFSSMSSKQLNITVYYKPVINETKLPSTVPVFRGYPDILVCEAEGKPEPNISWIVENETKYSPTLSITESTPEKLYCVAENSVNTTIREVKVVLKEDYLPLIAGLVAITVAFISVIFIFIYSIYYKTAKMGRYSLKDAKPSAQNGDIAQNGKDSTLPMKKVSQCAILA